MVKTLHLSKYNGMNKTTTRTVKNVSNKDGYALGQPLTKEFCWQRILPSVYSTEKVVQFYESTFWTNGTCFYLDGNKFILKLHPQD